MTTAATPPSAPAPVVSRAKAYLQVRHKAVRDAMKQLNLDAILLNHEPDLGYLTNFTGADSAGLIAAKDFYLVTDFRYQEQAQLEAGWLSLVLREDRMADALVEAIAQSKAKRVGFDANFMAFGQFKALEAALAERKLDKTVELVPLDNVMANIRKVKDDHEVDLIRKSVSVAEEAFDSVRGEIKAGLTENYLAGLLIFELRSRGASDSSFPIIVAAGANTSLPHYQPGESLVQRDQPLLMDWGALYKGYCSDLTRTLFVGRIPDRFKKLYKIVLEA